LTITAIQTSALNVAFTPYTRHNPGSNNVTLSLLHRFSGIDQVVYQQALLQFKLMLSDGSFISGSINA